MSAPVGLPASDRALYAEKARMVPVLLRRLLAEGTPLPAHEPTLRWYAKRVEAVLAPFIAGAIDDAHAPDPDGFQGGLDHAA